MDAAIAVAHSSPPRGQVNRGVRRKLNTVQHQVREAREPQIAVEPLWIAKDSIADPPHGISELFLRLLPFSSEAGAVDILRLSDDDGELESSACCLLR